MKKLLDNKLLFIIPLCLLMIISLYTLYNIKYLYKYNYLKQFIWYILSIGIYIIIKKVNVKYIFKYSYLLYILSLFLLIYCLLWGNVINGARAWINLKFFSFQPSEFMKLSLCLLLSNISCNYINTGIKSEFIFLIKCFILTFIPSVLVFLEPDTGAIMYYLIILFSIIILTNIHKFWYILFFIMMLLFIFLFMYFYLYNKDLLIYLIGTSFFYRVDRLITFKTMNSYQLDNALIGMGSSSFLDLSFYNNRIYIPEGHTDFIFSYIVTNFGFMMGYIILILYLLMDLFLLNKIFNRNKDCIKCVLVIFTFLFIFGQVVNISMNLGLLPIMGIPLPFLSYGGSSIIIYFILIAIAFKKGLLKN